LAVLLAVAVGCKDSSPATGTTTQPLPVAADRLPANWDLSELAQAAHWDDLHRFDGVRVLVWEVSEDRRPLYVESCVVWVHWQESAGSKWRLAHLYRHPRVEGPPPAWRYSMVYDSVIPYRRTFDYPPDNGDVYRFLKDIGWKFRATDGFELRDAGVSVNAWQEVIGQPPERFYDPTSLKPGKG
jgi:hypothetical protein